MSASDSNGYFVELGEHNLIIARATLGPRPRTIETVQEVWIGDTAATDIILNELRPVGSSAKAVALLRLKTRGTYLADLGQAKNIATPDAIESFLGSQLGAENLPASWAWVNASNGQAPQGGARWALDAASAANTEEALGKLRTWSFELARCQSAPLTLAGGLTTAVQGAPVLLLEVSEANTTLIAISNQGITALATVPVGFDALAGATQTALGLKFRGSAARLMFNESYDFGETATSIVEPLANALKGALASLGSPAPTQLVCGGVLARQTWIIQTLAKVLGLTPFTLDAAAWASARGLAFGSGVNPSNVAPSWLGVLNAAASYEPANPGSAKAWNPLLSGTPVASASVVPAIIIDTPKPAIPSQAAKPAIIPAIIQEPAKPTAAAPAKPAVIPAIIQEPGKFGTPAKPAIPAIQPKPAVIITPPSKPLEPPKPSVIPAKPGTTVTPPPARPVTPPAKPAPTATPGKPAPSPVSAVKNPGKIEPPKPTLKPAPAPVMGAKPATAAPFPPKKNNKTLVIGLAVAFVVIGIVTWLVISNNEVKAQAEKERTSRMEADAKIKAEAQRVAEAEKKAEAERVAHQKESEQAELRLKNAAEEARRQQEAARNSMLYGRGSLTIATDPAGATVTVGELAPRASPVSMKDLRLGTYAVTITLPGYDTEQRNIEIKESETTDLGNIALKRQQGTIELTSEPANLPFEIKPAGSLFVNQSDIRTGQTPATLTGIPAGSYQVTVNRPNWTPYVSTVTVERNNTVKVNGDFPGGTVVITSSPSGATVLRDNQTAVGTTPLTLTSIPPGQMSFTVNQRGYDPVVVSGKLEGGKTLTLNATLLDSDRVMKLSELDERPSPIAQVEPELSTSQRTEGGSALISMVIGRDGVPTDLKIEQASSTTFGKVCLQAAAKWRFRPGVVHGKPAKTRVTLPFKIGAE